MLHGQIGQANDSFMNMIRKDKKAQKLVIDEYVKHWDNKVAKDETPLHRVARQKDYATPTQHSYDLATNLYEYGRWEYICYPCYSTPQIFPLID